MNLALKHSLVAAAALVMLLAFGAGSASADEICTTNTTPCTSQITTFESSGVGTATLETTGGTTLVSCSGKNNKGTIQKIGSAIAIVLSIINWFECTGTVTTIKNGSLEINSSGGTSGSVAGKETEVTVGVLGTTCTYGTGSGTTLGTINGTALTFNAVITKTAGSFLCPSSARYTGSEKVTNHNAVFIHNT